MSPSDFLRDFKDTLGTSVNVTEATPLADIPEWDSLSIMSVVTLLASQYGSMVTFGELKDARNVGEVMAKAGVTA